jgi:hypothetical protein
VFRRPLAPRRPDPDRQCTATSLSTDARCERWASEGEDTCGTHRTSLAVSGGPLPALRRTGAAVTASVASVQLDGVSWQSWKFGSSAWQREAWRLYDITGQLRFVANWVGHSVSRCRLYVAEVDESGEAGQEATDLDIASLAAGPLGSGPAKDEALRLLGINLFVPGEGYVIAEGDADGSGVDRWFVVAGQQIKRSGDQILIRRSQLQGGGDMVYRPDMDLILRVWTPHPADTDQADSPTRSAIPDLREIEALRKREFAELDSRLAGAGVLFLPDGVEFPRGDDDPPGTQGLASVLQRAMAASLQDRSSAAAMVPIIATAPAESIRDVRHLTFWTDLSDQLLLLREAAVKSLAQSLDVPAEILLGLADSNHWSAWQVSEDAVTTQIVPVLSRIADALTTGYLRRALEQMGKDPDKWTFAFDTAPLTTRPNRTADALNYHGAGLISDAAAVEAGAFRIDQMPDDEERLRRIVERAVAGAPSLLGDPMLQELLGLKVSAPPPAEVEGAPAPPPPAPVKDPESPPEPTPQTEQDAASLTPVANLAVRRALTLAGSRLVPHRQRDRCAGARYDLHTCHGPVAREQADEVLRGAWDDLPAVAADLRLDPAALEQLLHGFATELLTRGMAYDPGLLRLTVTAAVRAKRLHAPQGIPS